MKALSVLKMLAFCAATGVASSAFALKPEELGGLRVPSLFAAECMAIPYAPSDVYDAPGGLLIGRLVLDHPEYAAKTLPGCSFRPIAHLQPEGRMTLVPVKLTEVGNDEPGLAVYQAQTYQGSLWLQGRSQTGSFWLPVRHGSQYLSFERDLVQGLALFSEACDDQGRCNPAASELMKQVGAAGEERQDTCYGNAYDIEGLVTLPGGRRVYKVRLAETLAPKYGAKLPAQAYVPTYDYRGRWTGFFFSRGC